MSTNVSNMLTCYLIQSYLLKKWIYYACAANVSLQIYDSFKRAILQWRAAASVLILLLCSDNLLTDCEPLNWWLHDPGWKGWSSVLFYRNPGSVINS